MNAGGGGHWAVGAWAYVASGTTVLSAAALDGGLPGPAFALNTANHWVYAHGPSPSYYVAGGDELRFHASECAGRAIGMVLGKTAAQAREALRACIREDGFGATLSTGWEDHAAFGRTWVASFGSFDGPGLLIRYAPEISMPVEIRSTSHRLADGRIIEEEATMNLTGWMAGADPLAPLLGGTPALPSVPLVDWGMYGPATGDLEPFPVRQAREALAQTDTGDEFFAAYPDASLQYARYSPQYPPRDGAPLHPANFPSEEVDCQQRNAGELTGAEHPGTADVRWLRTRWADGTGYLYGHAHAPGTLLDAGIATAYSDQDRMETGPDEAGSPDRGPRWHDLLAAEDLVKNMGGNGRLIVTVAAPSLPTLAWDDGVGLDFSPWLPTHGDAFTGTVGLASWCTTAVGIDVIGNDQGLAFVDGRLAYAWAIKSDVYYNPSAPVPAWGHPAEAFEGGGGGGASWVAAGLAGLGILGLLAIAIKTGLGERIALAMFSRFRSGEAAGHPMRQKILTQVKAQPGIRLPALADTLGEPRPRLSYHVRMLEQHDMVRVSRTWRGLVLHPKGHAGTATAGVLNRANARELLALLDRRPASDVSSVAAELGIHKSRISRLSQDLEVAGLIVRRRVGRALHLSLSDPGRDLLKSSNPQRRQRPSRA